MDSKFDNEWNIWYHNIKTDWTINGFKKIYNIYQFFLGKNFWFNFL